MPPLSHVPTPAGSCSLGRVEAACRYEGAEKKAQLAVLVIATVMLTGL